jgi:hypothetical protein
VALLYKPLDSWYIKQPDAGFCRIEWIKFATVCN